MVNAGGMITALVLLLTLLLIQVRMLDFSSFKCEENYYFPDPMLPQLSEVFSRNLLSRRELRCGAATGMEE